MIRTWTNTPRNLWKIAWVLIILGFGLRMVDLMDPPADFHSTRQYRGAIIARSIYYDHLPDADPQEQALAAEMRADFPEFEPPVLESFVALGYLVLGHEALWLARVIVSLIWCLGGAALFVLIKESVSGGSALIGLAYYLFLPFGVIASRSFQPDPIMTVGLILVALSAYRWSETRAWKWAFLTGLLGAVTVLIKAVAGYLIIGMMVGLVLKLFGLKKAVRSGQLWAMVGIMAFPPGLYYLLGIGDSSSSYFQNWMMALQPFILTPAFYIGWLKRLYLFNPVILVMAAVGFICFAKDRSRWMLWGLWIGYALYGFSLPYQTATHNYYHIQITPLVAWSLAYFVEWGLKKMDGAGYAKWRSGLIALFVVLNFYWAYDVVNTLLSKNYRAEPAYWESVAEQIPEGGETIGLVQQYGHLLMYYGWVDVELWPVSSEQYLAELRGNLYMGDFPGLFAKKTAGFDYFLVTTFAEFEKQTELRDHLNRNFSVYAQGPGYLIFDLQNQTFQQP